MSKRGTVHVGASRKEYAAAEERLLNIFSPPPAGTEEMITVSDFGQASAASPQLQEPNENVHDVDPSRDNMLQFISDDSEIRSLLANSDSNGFKGFDDTFRDYGDTSETLDAGNTPLIFGMFRNMNKFIECQRSNRGYLNAQLSTAPMAVMEATTSANYLLTNGNINVDESEQAIQEQVAIDCQNVIDQSHSDCVIYDDDNVVLLTDDQCCEIIVAAHGVHTDHEIERAYLLGLQQQSTNEQERLNNGVSYCANLCTAEEYEDPSADTNVYLSDAALDPQHQHNQHHQQQQQQLLLDANEEDPNQISDPYVDERPDICEVYDHELEDHDDDCIVNEEESNLELLQQVAMEQQQQLNISSSIEEPHAIDVKDQQATVATGTATAAIPHSSTTEFPVSSTSMPNDSDYDDCHDDVGTAEEQSLPRQRKYMPLLKNTLSAEAMDRRMANICQSQPQMSLNEKLANWNCANSCDAVEDVENFETVFEQHEAEPGTQKFSEFYEYMRKNFSKMTQSMQEGPLEDAVDETAAPEALKQKRPCYRRLLPSMPVQQTELIVLDDDDDDDDCFEVMVNPSSATLVPRLNCDPEQPEAMPKKTQTQPILSVCVESKETSTTDLVTSTAASEQQEYKECRDYTPVAEQNHQGEPTQHQLDVPVKDTKEEVDQNHMLIQQQQESQCRPSGRAKSVEFHNDAQFYKQHEFCNYLGLTELATANAVATAMRELANSNVARRSLRVRTQQQLDRMRSDVRGRRRERQQQQRVQQQNQQHGHLEEEQQQQQRQLHEKNNQLISDDSSTITNNTIAISTKRTGLDGITIPPATDNTSFIYPRQPATGGPPIEYYCHAKPDNPGQNQGNRMMVPTDYHAISLEAAFAKVYASAAPAQNELHECMQNRLRQARETKPSIYIVKSMNNATTPVPDTSLTPELPEHLKYKRKPELPLEVRPLRKVGKKMLSKASKRRRTTGGAIIANTPNERDLVTRSTTHLNSKLLRNRKVSLLKTYELTDVATSGRGKRLAGGSTPAKMPKVLKRKVKKTTALPEQMVISLAASINNHPDKLPPPPPPPKVKLSTVEPNAVKRKRLRAKSLPSALGKEEHVSKCSRNTDEGVKMPDISVKQQRQRKSPKAAMDIEDFITNSSVISPPLYSAAVRHYVNVIRQPKDLPVAQQPNLEQQSKLQMPPPSASFFEGTSSFEKQCKPSLTYPPLAPPPPQRTPHFSRRNRQTAGTTQNAPTSQMPNAHITPPVGCLLSLKKGSTELSNPLAGKNGKVLYIYYELDQLIVVQEKLISFWKYSKVFNVLQKPTKDELHRTAISQNNVFSSNIKDNTRKSSADSEKSSECLNQKWVYLGGMRHVTNDIEISSPYDNRLCTHNSTPVYIEMRSHPLDHHKRESKLLSLYVNVYYYCEEEMRPKLHSVHLDAVNCDWNQVVYTSITESRYFVMAWQQDLMVGKPRAGICKYSLTPTLDTLASIREFKQLRHELKHIECLMEDRLIGYGQTRITIWDHRSGDTLMNYDLGFDLGQNMGVMHFPSFEMDQSSLLVLYQHVKESNKWPELRIIACELSHAAPTHRILHVHRLPSPQFDSQLVAINTGDHVILKSPTDDEIWITTSDPQQLIYLAPQGNQRFYTRQKSQIIIMTPSTLIVDSISNHVLKLATAHLPNLVIDHKNTVKSAVVSSQLPV
ncbi:uncharacterized protein LOC111603905 [Drosophila hydei]|uniref:Uncharacterized protein LOC111603905 n=1 Tax=Drosophila hydei TaxID=7224 RepID=A0A6J1MAP6_DROHY|nr:uncharacterized protein LOC111603905 [Drosophila hydei]